MARLTREQMQAETRQSLLASARIIFAREGYGGTSVDRIAEEAGYSKGTFYSNFNSKDDIFLEVIEGASRAALPTLLVALEAVGDPGQALSLISDWAETLSKDGEWALLLLEHIRHARINTTFGDRQRRLFREEWTTLGSRISEYCVPDRRPPEPDALGALVYELAYGPAMSFSDGPKTGALIRLALASLFGLPIDAPATKPG